MHCVNCGTQNLETTRYCKSCGANLEVLRQALTQNLSSGPLSLVGPKHVGAILFLSTVIGLGGLGIVFGCLVALANSIGASLGKDLLPLLLMLGMAGVAGICIIVVSLLRTLRGAASARRAAPPIPVAQAVLEPAVQNPALPSYREPVSVVEHTTARLGNYAPPEPKESNRS
jgi:zinc ribbon protein